MFKKHVLRVWGAAPYIAAIVMFFMVAAPAAGAASWNLADDYSTANTAGSAWTFGWESAVGGTFTQYDYSYTNGNNSLQWVDSSISSGYSIPAVWKNTSTGNTTIDGVAYGQVSLHPGESGQFSVVRWTASSAGTYTVSYSFGEGDNGWMSYYIVVDGVVYQYWMDDASTESGTMTFTLAAGGTIEFIVGANINDGYYFLFGNTPLTVTVTGSDPEADAVPEPAAMLLLGFGLASLAAARKIFRK
jgi:hypothetical protein